MIKITNPTSKAIWEDRYQKNGETLEEHFHRVSTWISSKEPEWEPKFFETISEGRFIPAGRVMSNAGIGETLTKNNCFCCNYVPDSMEGIMDVLKKLVMTWKASGGTGYNVDQIRPKDIGKTKNDAMPSGPVSFMEGYNGMAHQIEQGQ